MQTTEVYLRADPTEKIAALEAVMPPALRRGTWGMCIVRVFFPKKHLYS
jgi:hypothetical protein